MPVLCGSAFKIRVFSPFGWCGRLSSFSADIGSVTGVEINGENEIIRAAEDSEPFSGLAFKIMTDPFCGIYYFRPYLLR